MRVTSCEDIGNQYCLSQFGTKSIESICNKDRVLILTSFIAAHKHAHDTVLFYLGEQEGMFILSYFSILFLFHICLVLTSYEFHGYISRKCQIILC